MCSDYHKMVGAYSLYYIFIGFIFSECSLIHMVFMEVEYHIAVIKYFLTEIESKIITLTTRMTISCILVLHVMKIVLILIFTRSCSLLQYSKGRVDNSTTAYRLVPPSFITLTRHGVSNKFLPSGMHALITLR